MKEFKKAEITMIEAFKSKIWSMFDILRIENITSESYHVLLFILSAYKDGLFDKEILKEPQNLNQRLIDKLHSIDSDLANQYYSILISFEPTILQLSERGLRKIISQIIEFDSAILKDHFPVVFDNILYQIAQSQGKSGGEYIQPIELTNLICDIADLQPESRIFNPFAGLASFGLCFEKSQYYFMSRN
jgi:type I restriction enzyme M protein